jgi:hypothetical protein
MVRDWQADWKRRRAQFVQNWDWTYVLSTWRHRMKEFGVRLDPLFTEIPIWDPQNPVREEKLSWWPRESIRERQKIVQRHFLKFPGTRGDEHANQSFRQGEVDTLYHLWRHRDTADSVTAVLLAGSLFRRLESRRGQYSHEYWPDRAGVEALLEWATEQLGGRHSWSGWHYACTDVLPVRNDDFYYKIESLPSLVRYLAEEHAELLRTYRPVVVRFTSTPDAHIAQELRLEQREETERHERWKRERDEQEVAKKIELNALKKAHPRQGEWPNLPMKELRTLIWSKPATELARDFGISDVAIGKRCKALGIPKPPPGFWAKVAAGAIPHPQGQATDVHGRPLPEPPPRPKAKLRVVS